MFLNLIYVLFRFGLERELVVHLGIGIHVAYVVVVDQGHVTKLFFLTLPTWWLKPRGVTCVNLIYKSELIFTIFMSTA